MLHLKNKLVFNLAFAALLLTMPANTHVTGLTNKYGKARVVTLLTRHGAPTFEYPDLRKLLRQSNA